MYYICERRNDHIASRLHPASSSLSPAAQLLSSPVFLSFLSLLPLFVFSLFFFYRHFSFLRSGLTSPSRSRLPTNPARFPEYPSPGQTATVPLALNPEYLEFPIKQDYANMRSLPRHLAPSRALQKKHRERTVASNSSPVSLVRERFHRTSVFHSRTTSIRIL